MSRPEDSADAHEAEASCHGCLGQVGSRETLDSCRLKISNTSLPCLPVHENFKPVADPYYKTIKVVPPYWHTFETDVKLRWRDKEILEVVTREFRSRPESYYQRAIESGKFMLVNNQACRCDTVLRNGDHLTHKTLEIEFAVPWTTPVHVLYEDDGLVAAFKPAGMPVHPQGRYTQASLTGIMKRFHLRQHVSTYLHPVNRLDRVTAGVVILAKNSSQARTLTTAIGSALKLYIARVAGNFSTTMQQIRIASRGLRADKICNECKRATERFATTATEHKILEETRLCVAVHQTAHEASDCGSQAESEQRGRCFESAKRCRLLASTLDASYQDVNGNQACVTKTQMHQLHDGGSQLGHEDVVVPTSCARISALAEINGSANGNRQDELSPLVEERRRRKAEKRRWKEEKKQQRAAAQEQRQREHEARMSRQDAADEDLSIKDATHRGIFSLMKVAPPRCRPCASRVTEAAVPGKEVDAPSSALVAAVNERCTRDSTDGRRVSTMSDHEHPAAVAQSAEFQENDTYLKVSARLLVSSCLVGRQLAVGWNEDHGKEAETVFKMLHYDEDSDTSLVACIPLTGRTHQIRKHLQILGTSIVGDALYPPKSRMPHTSGQPLGEPGTSPASNNPEIEGNRPEHGPVKAPTKRASTERSLSVSFSLDELRAANRASLNCHCSRCATFTGKPDATSDGLSDLQGRNCTFVDALREMAQLSDVVVSRDGERAEVAYAIEEPCHIDLMSFAYIFDTGSGQQNTISAAGSRERDVSNEISESNPPVTLGATESPASEAGTRKCGSLETIGVGRGTTLAAEVDSRSTQDRGDPEAKNEDIPAGEILKDASVDAQNCRRCQFVIACPSAVMPDWTHPVKAEELCSLLDCLYLLHRQKRL
ncbi:RNA pseudouridine synthase superfamily protein [Toxoplasma gondii RUB]|uniref:RNA pseudouridine synthase superfamily protein n=1 Tax=Toxoplasma gondii RUB TaxID=935652 RepID=A0A086LT80_TOXGO|nr:RNA pseudouridine synthase superfamily protein [Toxoplasma gondii RUB]